MQNPLNKKIVPGLASWRTEPKELINQINCHHTFIIDCNIDFVNKSYDVLYLISN